MPTVLYTAIAADTLTAAGVSVIGHEFADRGRGQHLALLLDTAAGTVRLTDDANGKMIVALDGDPTDPAALAGELGVTDDAALASALDELLTASITAFARRLASHKDAVADELVADLVVDLSATITDD